MNAAMQGRWRLVGFMVAQLNLAKWELLGSDMQYAACDFLSYRSKQGLELEKLRSQPHRLFAMLFVDSGPAAQFLEIAAVGLLPKRSAISQHLARHLGQPGCQFGLELTVLLIDRCVLARMQRRRSGKAA